MERGVLFLAHMTDPEEKVIVGIKGMGIHTAILDPDEALRFAYNLIETVERMDGNKHPKDTEDED
jgi:hypothetical protein